MEYNLKQQIYREIQHWLGTLITDIDVESLITTRELNNLVDKIYHLTKKEQR